MKLCLACLLKDAMAMQECEWWDHLKKKSEKSFEKY